MSHVQVHLMRFLVNQLHYISRFALHRLSSVCLMLFCSFVSVFLCLVFIVFNHLSLYFCIVQLNLHLHPTRLPCRNRTQDLHNGCRRFFFSTQVVVLKYLGLELEERGSWTNATEAWMEAMCKIFLYPPSTTVDFSQPPSQQRRTLSIPPQLRTLLHLPVHLRALLYLPAPPRAS